jgi:hypothetical protein
LYHVKLEIIIIIIIGITRKFHGNVEGAQNVQAVYQRGLLHAIQASFI